MAQQTRKAATEKLVATLRVADNHISGLAASVLSFDAALRVEFSTLQSQKNLNLPKTPIGRPAQKFNNTDELLARAVAPQQRSQKKGHTEVILEDQKNQPAFDDGPEGGDDFNPIFTDELSEEDSVSADVDIPRLPTLEEVIESPQGSQTSQALPTQPLESTFLGPDSSDEAEPEEPQSDEPVLLEMLEDEDSEIEESDTGMELHFEPELVLDDGQDPDSEIDSDYDSDYSSNDEEDAKEDFEEDDSEVVSDVVSDIGHLAASAAERELVRRNAELTRLTLQRAESALQFGDLHHATDLFSDTLDIDPTNIEALLGRGRVHLDLGDYGRAMSDFTIAEDAYPESPEPQVAIGEMYFARKDYERAIEYFNNALTMAPNHAMAHCRRGISHYYRRNDRRALADLTRSQKLDPSIPNIKTYVAMARKRNR